MIDRLIADSIALLRKMIAVPSVSFDEGQVCGLIASALKDWGIDCSVIGHNIVAFNYFYDPSKATLALDAHIDTVPASESYTRDPFDPGMDPAVVYGLGANDDGGSVVSMIAAFRYFYKERMPVNLLLTLTCEEERSGPGGARLLYSADGPLAGRLPEWVIVGEPTGMKAATSERGLLVLDCVAKGVTGHAARNEGVNALYKAVEDIEVLRSHKFAKKSPLMGEVKLNVTQIEAGHAHNVIPDSCKFVVDIRPTEMYTPTEILGELQALCQSELTPRNLNNLSSATSADSRLLGTLAALGVETFSSPTTSNWIRLSCDAVKMGPGDSSRSHRADEYLLTSEIEDAVKKYITFIETFYGNTLE